MTATFTKTIGAPPGLHIQTLFDGGIEGTWLSQNDLSVMFKNNYPRGNVALDGDPEGLILDKRLGLPTEADIFNGGYGFGSAPAATLEGDFVNWAGSNGGEFISYGTTPAPDSGAVYEIQIEVSRYVSGDIAARVRTGTILSMGIDGIGIFTILVKAGSGSANFLYDLGSVDMTFRINYLKKVSGNHWTQNTTAAKPTFHTDGTYNWATFDGVDDALLVEVPTGGWSGTYVQGTMAGTIIGEIDVPAGTYQLPINPIYENTGTLTELIIRDDGGVIDPDLHARLVEYVQHRGSTSDFTGVTNFSSYFRGRTDFTHLDISKMNLSAAITLQYMVADCSNLTSIDLSGIDTSSTTSLAAFFFQCSSLPTLDASAFDVSNCSAFFSFANGCTSLTALDVSSWDTSSAVQFQYFINNCDSLTSFDISNWNTSLVTNFQNFANSCNNLTTVTVTGGTGNPFADSPCTNYANAFTDTALTQQSIDDILVAIDTAGTSNGTFDQSGGSAPSATGEAAITSLRGRGWTVTVTGGF